jgi:transcriptional regulator with XRE-family HTH domain
VALGRDHLAFGDELRALRLAAGFVTGKAFAAHLGWVAPKVSRIETGAQLASDADLRAWLAAVQAPEDTATDLRERLLQLRLDRASWKRQLRGGHAGTQTSAYELERRAARIVMVEFYIVPGLLQTPEYARTAFTKFAAIHQTPGDTEAAVRERMRRQEVLYDPGKQIELLVGEAALRNLICPPAVMRAQLDRLANASGFSNVRVGIIPLGAELPVIPMSGFWMVDDQVMVEVHHTEIATTDPDDVALYNRIVDQLWTAAVEGDDARALILGHLSQLGEAGLGE